MTTLPKEIAEARLAQTQAWNEYMKIIERPHTFKEYHEALNKAGEADRVSADWYRRWQAVGGTSDIESIVDAERFLNLVEVCLTEPSTIKIVTVTKSAWQIEAEALAADYAEDAAMRNDLYNMGMGA